MATEKKSLSLLEAIFYYGGVIFSFGGVFLFKVIIKKAIIDAQA